MYAVQTRSPDGTVRRRPLIIAHRGSSGVAPENTLEAFRQAILDGADMIELDVQLTRDGVPVVFHDMSVERTTDGAGRISQMTLADVQKLDAGYKFQRRNAAGFPFRGRGVKVPTLEQVLQEFPAVPLIVEFKENNRMLIKAVVSLLERFDRIRNKTVICSSFEHRVVRALRKNCPALVTSFSIREVAGVIMQTRIQMLRSSARPGDFVFQVQWKRGPFLLVTPRMVRKVQSRGYAVQVWTVNHAGTMKSLIKMGVDGIFTDYPAKLREVIDKESR